MLTRRTLLKGNSKVDHRGTFSSWPLFLCNPGWLFVPAYPIKAKDPRSSIKIGSVTPSLMRAALAGCQYLSAAS